MDGTVKATRFQVHENNVPKLPGCCGVCNGINGPFIDTHVSKPMFGTLYICGNCLTEMYGMLPQPVAEEVPPPPPSLTQEEFEVITNDAVARLLTGFSDLARYMSGANAAILEQEVNEPGVRAAEGESGSPASASGTAIEDERPISVEGPDDISGDSSDGSAFDL